MDQLRTYIALIAKHLDAQIALLMSPEFSGGLPASLAANQNKTVKFGLKGLQIAMHSVAAELTYYANGITHLFSSHCEQFNQNINSLSYNSANLAWKSVELLRQYLAMASIVAVLGIELRTYQLRGHYDAREFLTPPLVPLYEKIYASVNKTMSADKPFILNNHEQSLDDYIKKIADNVSSIFSV